MVERQPPSIGKWRFILLALPFFTVGLFGWLRFAFVLVEWEYIASLNPQPGPEYLAIGGAVWGLSGLAALALLRMRTVEAWFRPVVFILGVILALTYWGDFLSFTRSAEMLGSWPFALALTVLTLAYIFFLLRLPLWWRSRKEAANVLE